MTAKRSAFDASRDQRIANEPPDDTQRCLATGCPNAWSIARGAGRGLCRWHDNQEPSLWPAITQQQLDDETERALANSARPPRQAPQFTLTHAEKQAILDGIKDAFTAPKDPRAWAYALQARHQRGERLTPAQVDAYRAVVPGYAPAPIERGIAPVLPAPARQEFDFGPLEGT